MSEQWWQVLFAGSFAGTATFIGMSLVLLRENWSRRYSAVLVSFSAGVLLGVGVLHVIPQSMELTTRAPLFILLAFVLFYFFPIFRVSMLVGLPYNPHLFLRRFRLGVAQAHGSDRNRGLAGFHRVHPDPRALSPVRRPAGEAEGTEGGDPWIKWRFSSSTIGPSMRRCLML